MTREEFMNNIKPKMNVPGDVLLTWYDENYEEFVVYLDNYKGTGERMLNHHYEWDRFECNITAEEFDVFLEQLLEGSIGDNQKAIILDNINKENM